MLFSRKKHIIEIKGINAGIFVFSKKIYRYKKKGTVIKFSAKNYIEPSVKIQKFIPKNKHFAVWASKLLIPDFLIGHPNLWDNLKILRKNPQFKPLRMALATWLIFTMVAGSTGIYALLTAPKADAADSWYDVNWLYRKKITLANTTANLGVTAETLTDFPILVKLDSGTDIDYTKTQDLGQDIRFTDSNGTDLLKYEIEKWDETGSSYVWVKVPSIDTTGDDYIYIYYNNAGASDGQDATNVWNSSYVGVWHMNQDPSGSAPQILDSTANNRDGTTYGSMSGSDLVDGNIGKAINFDGSDDYITVSIGTLNAPYTIETSAYFDNLNQSAGNYDYIMMLSNVANTAACSMSRNETTNTFYNYDGTAQRVGPVLTGQTWLGTVLQGITSSPYFKLYFSGALQTMDASAAAGNSNGTLTIGRYNVAGTHYIDGKISEIRISNIERSVAWIAASYKSDTDAFNTFDIEEASNRSPNTPTNSLPANAATRQSITPTLTSSTFSDPDTGDTHEASQWQITTTSGNYSSTVYDSGTDTTNKTSIVISPALSYATTYYWHVRHKDSSGNWSTYSTGTSFTTVSRPAMPTNSSPINGSINQDTFLTLTASEFSDVDPGSSQSAAQWQVRTLSDATYISPAFDSGTDTTNKTSIDVTAGSLAKNTVYYWHVRYKDDLENWSAYSTETVFTTGKTPITVVSTGATEYQSGETAKLTVQIEGADSTPINNATTTVTIYSPATPPVALVTNASMTYIADSNGLYYYNYTVPATEGVYTYQVKAVYLTNTSYSSHAFHVSPALNTIATLNTNLNTVNTNAQTEQTAQEAERTAQEAERTAQEASRLKVEDIQTDVHTANSNLDILVGALIVTQSAVNDTSATTTYFDTDLTNATNDFYKNSVLTFTSGNLNGQVRRISAYNGSTKVITLDPALTSAPVDNDTFTIVKQNVRVEEQATDIHTDVAAVQTDVTYIRSKVDSIYTLLGTVDTNLSAAQTAVNNIRTSQQKAYKAKLSDVSQINTDNAYTAKLTLLDYEDNPIDAASTPTITIYDSTGAKKANAQNMTKDSTGNYSYSYSILSTDHSGNWEAIVTTAVGSNSNQILNDYFDVTGSPAQVTINSVSTTIPTITADAKITNEGASDFEYHYEWCVVSDQSNQCGGSDDIDYGSDSKLIEHGEYYEPVLTATVPTAGTYWFKLVVYYGTQASDASRQFTATASTISTVIPPSIGGGYTQILTVDALGTQINTMKSLIENQSSQLEKIVFLIGSVDPKSPGFKSLLTINQENAGDMKSIQNKINDLKTVSEITKTIVKDGVGEPVIQTWYTEGSIILNVLVTNPTDANRVVGIKQYLPKEIKSRDIIDMDPALTLQYDANLDNYYISASVSVKPGESKKLFVRANDVFRIADADLQSLRSQTETLIKPLVNTSYFAQGTVLKSEIDTNIDSIVEFNKMNFSNIEDRISKFREYQRTLESVKENIDALKSLVVQTSGSGGIVGKISGIQTVATWGIILSIILGFCLLSFAIFSIRKYRISQPDRQSHANVIMLDAELVDALKNIKKINEHLTADAPMPKKNE